MSHVMAHLAKLRSSCARFENSCSLVICGCMWEMLPMIMAMSSTYAIVLQVAIHVLK